ncbi:MAG: trigger factor [Candidatus Omnitrophica bacterium]|nr:trigger factor [Candidatus Omnitrophota bacterium]
MKLKINVKDVNSCEKMLTIDVPSEVVAEEFSAFYEAAGKQAKIPGFRPGHAPKHVVALHYKEEARQEVWKQLVSKSFRDAVRQEEIPVIGYPRIENIEFDETKLKFKAHVEMRPKIKIEKYAGLSVKRDPVQVNESEIEETLKRIQEAHAKFQAVEGREAQLGDFLICDYRLNADGQELEKREGEWIEIREKDYLEGFSKQLIGIEVGQTRAVTVTFPSDYNRPELAKKQGLFTVTIHEIKEKKLPELDDELAKEAGKETLAELKSAIQSDLENHKRSEAERKVENALLEELIKKSKFEVPSGMVERRLDALVEEGIQSLIYRGVKKEDALKQKDEIRKTLTQEAERQVRLSFILDEIATREHIEAREEDLNQKYQAISARVKRPLEEVKSFYAAEEERRESLLHQIVTERTIQWIKDKAVIQEQGGTK